MARARLISRSLVTSNRFARLWEECPALAEFAQLLYVFLCVHADDFGREEGDAATVKFKFHPRSPRPVEDFARALEALAAVGLIAWYEADGRRCFEVVQFEQHQAGLKKRTRSHFPAPPGASGNFPELPGTSGNRPEIPGELKGTEENRSRSKMQRCALFPIHEVRRHLQCALHRQLDEAPDTPIGELAALVKDLAHPLGFTWNTPHEITALIDGVLGQRAKAGTGT